MEILIPGVQSKKNWWKALLIEEELVDRSIFYFEPWDSEPDIAVPVGKFRRTGYCVVKNDEFREDIMRKMRMMPLSYPDVRRAKRNPYDIEWGDNINDLWKRHEDSQGMEAEIHRLLGRAFGYKEERIMALYPPEWPEGRKESTRAYKEKFALKWSYD